MGALRTVSRRSPLSKVTAVNMVGEPGASQQNSSTVEVLMEYWRGQITGQNEPFRFRIRDPATRKDLFFFLPRLLRGVALV